MEEKRFFSIDSSILIIILLSGTWVQEKNHNYYPEFRKQYRHPNQARILHQELPIIKEIDEEERPTYFTRKSRDQGYLGLSILHRLHPLYGFNYLTDTVFDVMHLLPLNVVKNHIERLISGESCDRKSLQENLSKMPWTTGMFE